MIYTPQRVPWRGLILATLVAAMIAAIIPLTATTAHADTETEIPVVITANDSNPPDAHPTYNLARLIPRYCSASGTCGLSGTPTYGFSDEKNPDGTWLSNQHFTMLVNSDGSFHLRSEATDDPAPGTGIPPKPCVNGGSGGLADAPSCGTSSSSSIQVADEGGHSMIRYGNNNCLARTESGPSPTNKAVLASCNSTDEKQQWNITTANNVALPEISKNAAIDLGANKITVCNSAAYQAYWKIDYTVYSDKNSDTAAKDTRGSIDGNSLLEAGQCHSETLPAGRIVATVNLAKQTTGAGDPQAMAQWGVVGPHLDATFRTYGTTCGSSSTFEQSAGSYGIAKKANDNSGCDFGSPDWGAVGVGLFGALFSQGLGWAVKAF